MASISPLLATICLHYAVDLWAHQWRNQQVRGEVILVGHTDDFVVGFEHHFEAERFRHDLTERLKKFNLELPVDKTRLIEFDRYAKTNRA